MGIEWRGWKNTILMSRQIVVGIDIGSSQVKVIVAEGVTTQGKFNPKIIGTGLSESRGMKRGFVANPAEVATSIKQAVQRAEKSSNMKIRRAFVSFGGIGLSGVTSSGQVAISRADMEITEKDIELALESAEKVIPEASRINRKIINTIPIEYKVDGKTVWGQALGLKAHKLEVKALFITCLEHHLNDLIHSIEEAGVEVADIVALPIAESFVTLNKKEKRVGSLLIDLGAETLTAIAFENGDPVSLEVFPIGGSDITNDLALGLKLSLDEAEKVKLSGFSPATSPKKKFEEIIASRLTDAFEAVAGHLKKINRHALLPAGVVISGGGASTIGIKEVSEGILKLPTRISEFHFGDSNEFKIRDGAWSVACGLTIIGFNSDNEKTSIGNTNILLSIDSKSFKKNITKWINQFLP